jgi:arginyl-tRNA--protein-N-Asp/Glu arginylyltransferase
VDVDQEVKSISQTDNWNSCCPVLGIRLPVAEFQPTKSQRRVLRKMQRLLTGEGHAGALASAKSSRKARKKKQSFGDEIAEIHILTQLADCTRLALQLLLKHTTIQQPIRYKTTSTERQYHHCCFDHLCGSGRSL